MKTELPYYAQVSLVCVGIFVFVWALSMAQEIIVPLLFAGIIATVLSPLVNFLVKRKWNRIAAISVVLFTVTCIAISLGILLVSQLVQFGKSLPAFAENFNLMAEDIMNWFSEKFNISIREIHTWMNNKSDEMVHDTGSEVGTTLMTTGGILIVMILIPVYVFMILVYQPLLIEFIHRIFYSAKEKDITDIISKTKKIIQRYLVGLLFEAIIIAVLYSVALLILGVEYAILLAVIGAILNTIPYLGAILGAVLPMVVALATQSPLTSLLVLAAYLVIQLIDNNYIIPKIVASKVRINALVSIVVVITGGMIWGISGMFLSIPLTAIFKVIFDHVDELKPWGYLLGNSVPATSAIQDEAKSSLNEK